MRNLSRNAYQLNDVTAITNGETTGFCRRRRPLGRLHLPHQGVCPWGAVALLCFCGQSCRACVPSGYGLRPCCVLRSNLGGVGPPRIPVDTHQPSATQRRREARIRTPPGRRRAASPQDQSARTKGGEHCGPTGARYFSVTGGVTRAKRTRSSRETAQLVRFGCFDARAASMPATSSASGRPHTRPQATLV